VRYVQAYAIRRLYAYVCVISIGARR